MGDIPGMISNIEIRDEGRELLKQNRRESDGESGNIDDLLPIFAKRQFEKDIAALSGSATISSPLSGRKGEYPSKRRRSASTECNGAYQRGRKSLRRFIGIEIEVLFARESL
jgi:hypothetical protein